MKETIWDRSLDIYNNGYGDHPKGGQHAIYQAVDDGELDADGWCRCEACDDKTPYYEEHGSSFCLVCWSELD